MVKELFEFDGQLGEFSFDFDEDFISVGEGATDDLEPSFSLDGADDEPWKFLGEMDTDERELMRELLNGGSGEGGTENS